MNSTAMQSALLTPDNSSPEEINELFKSVFNDLKIDVSEKALFYLSITNHFFSGQENSRDAGLCLAGNQPVGAPLASSSQNAEYFPYEG